MTKKNDESDQTVSGKVWGYARVSTEDQNLDMQIQALEKYGCDEIWSEKKSAQAPRAQFDLMTRNCRAGDTVVVWKLDRLARSITDLKEWMDKFEKWGVEFVCITDKIDTTTAMGRMFFHIVAAFAQLERDLISERTKAGMAARKAQGFTHGRPTKIYGEKRIAMARDICNLKLPMKDVKKLHGYKSLTTLNRHFPGLRQDAMRNPKAFDDWLEEEEKRKLEQEEKDDG